MTDGRTDGRTDGASDDNTLGALKGPRVKIGIPTKIGKFASLRS